MGSIAIIPGFGFYPSDAELIGYYLSRKLSSIELPGGIIIDHNIYGFEPSMLPGML